ncbi:MAG: DUF433 domain-containing protein [Bacteroidales bacterium]|nr:DUF433 domain-containing protein [Bacteroidales bacterium]
MENNLLLNRITINPEILTGKPVIDGTRLSVQFILGLMASGAGINEILAEYPNLVYDDILACLLFASVALDDNTFIPLNKQSA